MTVDMPPVHARLLRAQDFDWDSIQGSSNYRDRVLRRARREQQRNLLRVHQKKSGSGEDEVVPVEEVEGVETPHLPEDDFRMVDDWKKDPGERARCIWIFWTQLFPHPELTCFAKALRLVVLKQTSSATIERIFSQLTYIQRICGLATTSETLRLRLLIRCNEGCMDDFDG